jgi:hypothetical protein
VWEHHAISAFLNRDGNEVALRPTQVGVGREYAPLETSRNGPGVLGESGRVSIVRDPLATEASTIEWDLPRDARLIHLRGRAFLGNPLGAGMALGTYPLRITTVEQAPGLTLAPLPRPTEVGGAPVLPLTEEFSYWIHVPSGSRIRLASTAGSAVIEIEMSAFSLAPGPGSAAARVEAYDASPRSALLSV